MPWLIGGYVSWLLKPRTCGDRQTESQTDGHERHERRSRRREAATSSTQIEASSLLTRQHEEWGRTGRQAMGGEASVEPQPHSNNVRILFFTQSMMLLLLLLWRSKVNTLPAKVTADAADVAACNLVQAILGQHNRHELLLGRYISLSLCLWNVCILISFKQKTFV